MINYSKSILRSQEMGFYKKKTKKKQDLLKFTEWGSL